MTLAKPDLRVVIGKGGMGKSTLIRHQVERHKRVLVFDPKAEPDYARGFDVIDDPALLVDAFRAVGRGPIRVAWRGVASMGRDAFEHANRVAWAAENLTVVWEEVDVWVQTGRLPDWAFKIANEGRHRDIRVLACARRPARVSRDLTANASRIVVFHVTEPRDLEYLREYMGEDARKSADLDPSRFEALDWREGRGVVGVKKSPFA